MSKTKTADEINAETRAKRMGYITQPPVKTKWQGVNPCSTGNHDSEGHRHAGLRSNAGGFSITQQGS